MVFFVKNRKTGVAMPKRAEKNIDRKTPSSIPRSDSEWEDIDECEDCPSTGPSSSENNFAKCLRGAPDKEIQVMTGLNKHGYDIMKKLVKYLQKVIDVEKAYSSALKKLNDIDFPSIESVMGEKLDRFGKFKNGVNTAHQSNKDVHMVKILEDNKKEYLALQRNQDNYVTELRKIRNIFQNYIDRRQDYKDNLKKGLKKSIDKKNTVINKKEKLLKERQKLVEKRDYYVVQIEKDPSKASELGDKLDKTKKSIAENDVKEQNLIKEQEEAKQNLTKAMNDAAIKIYNDELARLNLVYGKLTALFELMKKQQEAAKERTEKISRNIEKGNPEIELNDFAYRYGGPLKTKA